MPRKMADQSIPVTRSGIRDIGDRVTLDAMCVHMNIFCEKVMDKSPHPGIGMPCRKALAMSSLHDCDCALTKSMGTHKVFIGNDVIISLTSVHTLASLNTCMVVLVAGHTANRGGPLRYR